MRWGFQFSILVLAEDEESEDTEHIVRFETCGQLIAQIGKIKVFDGDLFTFEGGKYFYFVRIEDFHQAVCYHLGKRYYDDITKEQMRWGHFYRIKELGWEDRFKKIGNIHDNPHLIGKEGHDE